MTANWPYQAVVFDLDGTLIDTEHLWDEVRRGLAAQDGVAWPEPATTAMMGMSTVEWSTYLAETVGVHGAPEAAARRTIDGMLAHYRSGVDILPGALAAVRRMAALGPVGIASSSPRELIEQGVRTMGIADLVDVVVSTEEVGRGKPAPDGYLRCCELLGVDAARCLAFEDSSNGVRSALAAGMTTVAVPPHFHAPSAEVLQQCHLVLAGLDQLDEDRLAALRPAA